MVDQILLNNDNDSYTINDDGTISIHSIFNISDPTITKLPFKIKEIDGNVNILNCSSLTSLEGFPKMMKGDLSVFNCENITSLHGLPEMIVGSLHLKGLNIQNLFGSPKSVHNLSIVVKGNPNFSFRGIPRTIRNKLSIYDFNLREGFKAINTRYLLNSNFRNVRFSCFRDQNNNMALTTMFKNWATRKKEVDIVESSNTLEIRLEIMDRKALK